ncbi:MAG: ATP-binding protein [Clostridiales bacterium]|jgi:anti-sigma regulatory factor (Ser/Thr protein kinase)|nr:ATP-binding protein [Clostridiales bacterium]
MRELSLNILDIAENSIKAGASIIDISLTLRGKLLEISVRDNGCGMDADFLAKVTDPFTTSRTTRKVGLGIPLFKMAAEMTGGKFEISSKKGEGTLTKAVFVIDSVDFMPMGDIGDTMGALIMHAPNVSFFLNVDFDGRVYGFDTMEIKDVLGDDVAIDAVEVIDFIKRTVKENFDNINGGIIL